jgi:histidinol-phosphate aminotransferase
MLEPRAAVLNLKEYHPPLAGRTGLRLDFNENTSGCSPRVLKQLREIDVEILAKYPEREPVERIVAAHIGLNPEQVLLTNGVDEAIHLLCQAFVDTGDEVLIVVPTFSMYEVYASAAGAKVITVQSGENFAFPLERLLESITPRTRLIAIASPNNPTGAVVEPELPLSIAARAPHAAVLVDEAYYDFHGKTVMTSRDETSLGAASPQNLFVARTFSKAYGLAGLRVGIIAGTSDAMRVVRKVSSPYNVNGVALAVLPEALADRTYVEQYVDEVRKGRERLQRELHNLGIHYWPSEANFVLAQFGPARRAFVEAMLERGILVRDRNSDPGCAGCVRITVGTEQQMDRLMTALREVAPRLPIPTEVAR